MKVLFLLVKFLISFMFLIGCGEKSKTHYVSSDIKQVLLDRKTDIQSWSIYCNNTAAKSVGLVDPEGCETGDAVLFNGLLCLSGEEKACDGVVDAFDESTGQWFRSEFQKDKGENSFSRDMAKGVLAYLIKTKDTERAEKWLQYIEITGKLCEDDTDGRCSLNPAFWGLMKLVWQNIGLKPNNSMILGNFGDDTTLMTSAQFTPIGFQLHLEAVNLFLRKTMNPKNDLKVNQIVADLIHNRQPDNPFFEYLKDGYSDGIAYSILDKCSKNKPESLRQWSWERDTSEKAWEKTMGHDCIFMINLLTK